MIESIAYVFLALLGIGFLIFIHELGHYIMARRVGIIVEVFSIGFGKSICEWEHKGVKWKIGILPFGGYVKMAGMEKKDDVEPSDVEGGYFGSKPWDRIKVAFMGPLVNIVFAFLAFALLWAIGGRDKPFADYTQTIGWVQKETGPYDAGIRPGDQVTTVNRRHFRGFQDFLYAAALDRSALQMSGFEKDYETGTKTPFTYTFTGQKTLKGLEKASVALHTMSAASYLLYDKMPSGASNELLPGSPLEKSGIEYGDQIVWVDGELIFSKTQLISVINLPKVLLTVEREGRTFLTRAPLTRISDLRLSQNEQGELDDWRHEANLKDKVDELLFIPYNLNASGVVEQPISYLDEKSEPRLPFEVEDRSPLDIPLLPGDHIVAVQGKPIESSYQLFSELQTKKSLIIVKKTTPGPTPSWEEGDKEFLQSFSVDDLEKITQTIGTKNIQKASGDYSLLNTVEPVPMRNFPLSKSQSEAREEKLKARREAIEEISDSKSREAALKDLKHYESRLMLGLVLQDQLVAYNPPPLALFTDVFKETYRTLYALVSGYLSPKAISGPVGMVQVIQYGWSLGVKEALFWLGMISLNLGLLNLLPIPILDGGHICFAMIESVTKKPLKAKTMERLIFPFVILFIILFVYLTFNDIVRIIKSLF